MTYSVEISDKALAEIDEALGWYAERSMAAAVRWYVNLKKAIRSLQENPGRCELAPEAEWCDCEIRQLLYGKKRGVYRILFEVRGKTVHVLRVRHAARKLLDADDI